MLNYDQIRNGYSQTENMVLTKSMMVEYLQYELLDSLFKQKGSSFLSFIGGTAIRIVYGGSRFSEDLDFDNFGLSFLDFQQMLDKVVKDMETKGFLIEFRFVEKGAFHCYVKFPNILYQYKMSSLEDEKILVRIDTVRKKKFVEPTMVTLNKFDVYCSILANPANILLSQKFIAILERKNAKGRDFFDVSYLYGFAKPDFEYIQNMTGSNQKSFTKKLLEKCESLDFNKLMADVEPFLFQPEQAVRVGDFNEFIRKQLNRG
jgi:predicted nucleotidyltransferase component of viral defense system